MTSHSFNYVECDVPEGMTLDEYRCRRARPARRGLVAWLRAHRCWPR
jgi:hypothetical protein